MSNHRNLFGPGGRLAGKDVLIIIGLLLLLPVLIPVFLVLAVVVAISDPR